MESMRWPALQQAARAAHPYVMQSYVALQYQIKLKPFTCYPGKTHIQLLSTAEGNQEIHVVSNHISSFRAY